MKLWEDFNYEKNLIANNVSFRSSSLCGVCTCRRSFEETIVDIIQIKEVKEKSAQLSIFLGLSVGALKEDSISKFSFNLLGATNNNVTGLDLSLVGIRIVEVDFKGQHLYFISIEKFTV